MSTAEKLLTIAENVPKVYNAGYEKGKAEGSGDSYYDTFWDARQKNGTACNYDSAFRGSTWTTETFKPKYDIIPTSAEYMFYGAFSSSGAIDLVEHLNNLGVTLDFSQSTTLAWLIYSSKITHLGVIDMRGVTSTSGANNVFRESGSPYLKIIDKVIVNEKYPIGSSAFINATKLEEIRFEGTITGSLGISSPVLSIESVESIIEHLADLTGGTAKTLTLHATVKEKLTDAHIADITSKNWNLA